MSCLQLEQRSHRHLMVVMSLLAQKVLSYLLDGVLWSFFAEPLCLSLFFTILEKWDMLWSVFVCFSSFRLSYRELFIHRHQM